MFRPTARTLAGHVHKPMIHFLGKRSIPKTPHAPKPHPQAPKDIQSAFSDFQRSIQTYSFSPSESNTTSGDATLSESKSYDFWSAPATVRWAGIKLEEVEIDAVLSGGASLRR